MNEKRRTLKPKSMLRWGESGKSPISVLAGISLAVAAVVATMALFAPWASATHQGEGGHSVNLSCNPDPFTATVGDTVTVTYVVQNAAGVAGNVPNHNLTYTLTDAWVGDIVDPSTVGNQSDFLLFHQSSTPSPKGFTEDTLAPLTTANGDQQTFVRTFVADGIPVDPVTLNGTFADGHTAFAAIQCNYVSHTQTPTTTSTATNTPTLTATPTTTLTPTPTLPGSNPPISKCTLQDLAECIRLGNPHLANLWLCQPVASCADPTNGVGERDFNLNLEGPVRGLDPKCSTPPCARQSIGSFQFEVRYDSKLISVQVEPGSLWPHDANGNLLSEVNCARIPTQNGIQFRCNIKGKSLAPVDGPGTLAVVKVTATADVYSMLIPNQENGIVTQLINQDCQLSDLQGHAIKLAGQSLPGVGPAVCDDADVTIRYLEGDVNADCEINVQDQQLIAFRWGAHLGSLLYNRRYDLEPAAPKKGDGDIDAKDLQAVWGRHTSPADTCINPHAGQDPVDPKAIPTKQPTPTPTPGT